jgi:hypothetical protein
MATDLRRLLGKIRGTATTSRARMQFPEQTPDLIGANAIACHYQANHRVSQKLFECRFGFDHFAPPDQRSPVFHGRVTRRCRQYGDSVADFEMRRTLTRKFEQSSLGTLAARDSFSASDA